MAASLTADPSVLSPAERKVLRTVPGSLRCPTCGRIGAISNLGPDKALIMHPGRSFVCAVDSSSEAVQQAIETLRDHYPEPE